MASLNRRDFLRISIAATGGSVLGIKCSKPDELDNYIRNFMKRSHIPGLAAAIVKPDSILWSKGYGWANIERKIPMTPDTVQNIASISKTITATAVMQLWEKSLFKLDEGVGYTLGHDGTDPGVCTWMMFRKTDNVGVIIFMNTLYENAGKIIQLLFGKAEKE